MKDNPRYIDFRSFPDLEILPLLEPDVVLAQYRCEAEIVATRSQYNQTYISLLRVKDGRIIFYREYWNPTFVVEAFGGQAAMNAAFNVAND